MCAYYCAWAHSTESSKAVKSVHGSKPRGRERGRRDAVRSLFLVLRENALESSRASAYAPLPYTQSECVYIVVPQHSIIEGVDRSRYVGMYRILCHIHKHTHTECIERSMRRTFALVHVPHPAGSRFCSDAFTCAHRIPDTHPKNPV